MDRSKVKALSDYWNKPNGEIDLETRVELAEHGDQASAEAVADTLIGKVDAWQKRTWGVLYFDEEWLRAWLTSGTQWWLDRHRALQKPRQHTRFRKEQADRGNQHSAQIRNRHSLARAAICRQLHQASLKPEYLAKRFRVHLSTIYRWLKIKVEPWWTKSLSTAPAHLQRIFAFAKSSNRLTLQFQIISSLFTLIEQLENACYYQSAADRAKNSWRWYHRHKKSAPKPEPVRWNSLLMCQQQLSLKAQKN